MKMILVVGSRDFGKKNDPNVIAANIDNAENGITSRVVFWEDIHFKIVTGQVAVSFGDELLETLNPSLVVAFGWYKNRANSLYRDIAFSFAQVLNSRGISFWNSEMLVQRSTSKLSCMVQLALTGVRIPQTTFSLSKKHLQQATLPFVAKAPAASRGNSNFLVDSEEVRARLLKDSERFLVQPFLENDHDLRVVCYNGAPASAFKRSRLSSSTHLNNTSQGGRAEMISLDTLPEELLTETSNICHIMKREMAGVDFIPDPSASYGYSCLEVNAIPQLTSGEYVEQKMEMFKNVIKETISE